MSSKPDQAEPSDEAQALARPTPGPQLVRDVSVAALGLVAGVAVVLVHRSTPAVAAGLAAVVAVSTWLAIIDFQQHRLPNRIVGPLALLVTLGVLAAGFVNDDRSRSLRAIGFGVAVSLILLVINILGDLGMGDVKYGYPMAATVGWFGWDALSLTIMIMTVGGGLAAIVLLVVGRSRNHRLSYGPYMALGLVGGLLLAGPG